MNAGLTTRASLVLALVGAVLTGCEGPVQQIPLRSSAPAEDADGRDDERSCDAGGACSREDNLCHEGRCVECVSNRDCPRGYECRRDDDDNDYECEPTR